MNKVFKVIWSNARKCYVVVSEIAKNHGKNNTRSIVSQLAARMEGAMLQMASALHQASAEGGQPAAWPRTAARWIVPLVLAGILLPASARATEITRADSNVGVIDVNGGVYDVYVQQMATDKSVGINQFSKFNLDQGHIANMYFNQKGGNVHVNDLVNLVQERIAINGMVNAVKNGKIDGNLYFLSPNGMAVGKTGVINAGKFTALVPGDAYWFKLWDRPDNVATAVKEDFARFGTRETTGEKAGKFKTTGVELNDNTDKNITIQGKINTRSGIVLGAGKIAIENGAVLKSQKDLDFNKLVNATAANLPSGSLNVTADKGGDIILRAETAYKYENSPLPIGTSFDNGISNISEYVSALTHRNSSAEVTVKGEVTGDGSVDISAAASTTFNNKDWPGLAGVSDIGKEYLNRLGLNIDADVAFKYNKASVAIENTGKVSAGGDARVQSDATVTIKMQSKTVGKKDPGTAPGGGNPGQSGTSSAVPVVAVAWADTENSALVDVKGNLSAGGDMKLAATTNTTVDLKAQATTEKASDDPTPGNFAYVSLAVLSGDSVAEVKAEEPGQGNQAGKLKAGGDFSAEAAANSEIAVEAIASGTNDTLAATSFAMLDYDSAANVDLKRSVEGASITAKADNEVSSLGISADNCAGEGADPFIAWKIKGDTNPGVVANWLKGKIGSGIRQGGSLQSFENAFSSALGYVTAGAAVGFVDNTNTANVTVAPGVELKATGDAVKKDSDGNEIKDEEGNPVSGGYVTLKADTNMVSFSHQVAGELNKQGTDAGQDSTMNVAAAALFSNIDNDATVELQSKEGKGVTIASAKGDINLQAKVDSDDENTLSTLRINDVSDVLDKFVTDLGKFGQDFSKFTKWKTEAAEIEKQQADGTISREEAGCRWYNAVAGLYDAIATLPKDYLRQSSDAKKIITALNDLVSPASYTNYYVRSYAIDGQDSHGANYDIAGSFNFASQENKGIVAIGENAVLTAGKNISIKAEGETEVISGTGNAGEWMAFSETNGTGAGASVAWQDISADGLVLVGKNVNMKAGSGTDKAEGNLSLHAGAEVFEMGILYSAGKADRSEWNGTFSLQNGGGNSLVMVDDEAVLDAAGKVSLTALNDITVNNIAGSLALGSSKSKFTVGAGVAVNWLETNSMAVVGDNGTGASAQTTETDTEEFAKKSTEEQNGIIAANTLAAARKLAADRGSVRKMDREFEDSETEVKNLLGAATEGTARGSVTAKDINVTAQNDGTVNAVAVEGVSNSENHAGLDLINKVEKYGAQGKNDVFSFAQGVIGTPETILNKTASKLSGKDWGWGGKSMFAERKQVFNPIPENNDPADNGFNAALAGSLALNRNKAGTAAVVDNTNLTLRKEDGGKGGALVTAATDDIFTGAWSGAAAMNWFTGGTGVASNNAAHKGALGAAVALNSLNNNVNALISNAGISGAGLVDSSAIRNGAEAAAALGLAVTNDSGGTGTNGAVTFGLSVNKSTGGVHALLMDDTLTGGADSNSDTENGTDISIRTYDGDIQVAGGVDFSFANSADAGRAIAAGISAAASEIENDMRSGIQGGSYTGVGNLTVAGEDALTQVNAAVGIGISTSDHGFDAAGTLAVAELTNTNRAFISGTEEIKAAGNVSATSRDISGTEDNPYKAYLEKRNEDVTGSSYLSEEAKKKLGADAGSAFVNVAVDIAGSKAVAGGAGVAVGNLTNRFTADIAGNKKLEADSVKAAVHADTNAVTVAAGFSLSTEHWGGAGSFALNDLVQETAASVTGNRDGSDDSSGIKANTVSGTAKNDSDLLSITGDFAGAKGSALGLGLAYNFLENTTGVYVGNNVINAKDTARGVDVSLDANNNAYELALSVGAAVNNAEDNNFAAEGNFAVNRGHNDTIAVIGEDKNGKKGTYKDKISNASSVTVKATDATQRTTIAGDVDVAWKGSKVALGIGVAMTESERDSENNDTTTNKERLRAEINNADITTVKKNGQGASISAEATDTSQATTVAAGVGITKQSYLGAQGIGADANILKTNTAGLHDTTVDKNDTEKSALVNVKATTASTIKTGAAALQVSGENTYVTGVVAVGVNRIKDDTAAEVTYTDKQDARSMNAGNLDISAASQADILSVAAGASGTWKGSAAIGGSGSHNYIENNVTAKLEKADVNSAGNAGVVARSDEAISNYAGVLDVALQGSALSAAIGVTGSNNEISGTTAALIDNSKVVAKGSDSNLIRANNGLKDDDTYMIDGAVTRNTWSAGSFTEGEGDNKKYGVSRLQQGRKETEKTGVVVDASATHSISSVMANGGVAVNMGGGGGGGSSIAGSIAGVVNLNEVGGATTAKILDSQINSAEERSDVTVHAADYTNVAEFSGAAAIGVAQTGAVGAGFTGASNKIDRATAAGVSTSQTVTDEGTGIQTVPQDKNLNTVYAKNFAVTADAKQAMSGFNVAGAISGSTTFSAETGDNVNNNKLASSTIATVTNTTLDYTDKAKVEASHEDAVYNLNIDAGAAISPTADGIAVSVNAGVGVVNEESVVTANVENSELKKSGSQDNGSHNSGTDEDNPDLSIGAVNSTELKATLASAGAAVSPFSVGIATSVAVNNIETRVTSRIAGSTLTADSIAINTENKLTAEDRTGMGAGALIAGIGVGVDVNTFNDSVSTIIDNSTLTAKDKVDITTQSERNIDTTVAGVAIGIGEVGVNVLAVTVGSGLGDTEDIKEDENNQGSFSHKDAVNKALEKLNEYANVDLSEHFYGMTDEAKEKMKEHMKTVAKNGDGITGAGVHTYVRGSSDVKATGGNVTVFNNDYNDAELNGGVGGLGGAQVNVADTLFHLNQQNDIDVDNSAITGKAVALAAQQANKKDSEEAIRVRTVQAALGGAGVGVGYAGIVTKGSTGVSLNRATITTTDGDLTLQSSDTAKSRAQMIGVDANPGAGVLVTVANNEDKADNYVIVEGDSSLKAERVTRTETVKVEDEDGNIKEVTLETPAILSLKADRAGRTAAKTLGVGVQGVGVVVNNAYATDEGKSIISVNGGNNSFTADRLRLEAGNTPVLKAEAGGTGVSMIGVTVMNSNATAKSQALISVADNNKLLADNVEVKAVIGEDGKDMVHGETHSTNVSLGLGVAPNTARAITETTAKVELGKATYKTVEKEVTVKDEEGNEKKEKVKENVTDLSALTENNASRRSVLGNFSIGVTTSIGAGDAIAEGDDKSLVEARGGDVNNLTILAGGSSKTSGFADGDGGGLTDIGAHATITLNTKTTNTATLSGTWNVTDLAAVTADRTAAAYGTSRTGAGGGISVTWANSDNKLTMDTKTVLARDTVLNAGQSYVLAENHAKVGPYDDQTYSNHMNIGGVIQFSPNVKSDAVVDTKANIEVGENSKVTTKTGQAYDAHTELDHTNKVEGKGGGVAENIWVYSDNTVTSANEITVGKNSSLKQDGGYEDGDLTLSAGDDLTLDTVAEAYTGGVEGAIIAHTENNVTRNNKIKVDGNLYSSHDINLYAGMDSDGAGSSVKITTAATAYNRTLLSIYTDPEVTYDLKNNQQVEVGAGGSATSIRNINITADNGTESLKKDVSKIKFFGWRDEDDDDHQVLANETGKSNIKETNNNYVKVDGSLRTGIASKAIIEISGLALPEGLTPAEGSWQDFAVSTEGSTIAISKDSIKTGDMDYASQLGNQLAAVEKLIEEYGTGSNPEDTASYYGYVQQRQRILEDMEKHGLYEDQEVDGKTVRVYKGGGVTVRYVEIPELMVSGGNISINAENLSGTGKLDAGGTPQVKVTNHSNAYLKLDGARVCEAGGEIFFRGTGATLSSVAKNEDINKLNKNKDSKAAFTEVKNEAASGEASAILVENENPYLDAIKIKNDQGDTGEYHPVTDVAVVGDLTNDFGDVVIHNASGDITIGSGDTKGVNIIGKTVRLTALGSISQDYVEGIVNIGGSPKNLNSAETQKIIDKAKTVDSNTTEVDVGLIAQGANHTLASEGRIAGGSIYIAASDINVNGLIQSGFSKYEAEVSANTNESDIMYMFVRRPGVTIPEGADKTDSRYYIKVDRTPVTVKGRTLYRVNSGGRTVYDESIGAFKYIVQVYYDPQSKNLVMEDIDTQGGRIYLSGRISSTGNGKILAMNGGADISVVNHSALDMQAGKILNNNTEGKITITDVAKDTWTEYTPAFTRTITNYSQYAKDAAKAEEATLVTDGIGYNEGAETKGIYSVKEGQRYNWTLGSETGITKYYQKVDTGIFWGLWTLEGDTSFLSQYEQSPVREKKEGLRGLLPGEFIGEISDDYKTKNGKQLNAEDFGYVYENRVTDETRTVTREWKEAGDWWAAWSNPKYHLEWTTKSGSTQSTTFSLAADKDIAIGFIGSKDGNIEVRNSLGEGLRVNKAVDLILTDTIQNNSAGRYSAGGQVILQADRGSVIQKGNTALVAGKVNIEAQNNIENIHITSLGSRSANPDGTYTATDEVELTARSLQGGNITVDVAGGTVDGQLLPGNTVIQKLASEGANRAGMPGDVSLTAEGNIIQAGSGVTVRGLEVTLTSLNGGIGTDDQEIVLDTPADPYGMNPDSAAVHASARDSIYLKEEEGDMRVGSVVSREGDVRLEANGGRLLDALPETETTNNMDENDLVKRWIDAGLIKGTDDYEGAYIKGLKQDAANYAARIREQYQLCVDGAANDQIKEVFMNEDGSFKFTSAEEYLAQDTNYQAIVDKYTNPHFAWTKEQMLYAIRNAIINKESGVTTETQKKVANVQGKNVTLVAKGVGLHSEETTTILYSDITGGSDAAIANLKLLASADAEDVTMYDGQGHVLTFAADADGRQVPVARDDEGNPAETDGKVFKFVINNMSPLGVKTTGQLNITAIDENAYIAGRSDEKGVFSPVNTGIIYAGGQDVRLYTEEGIYNALKGVDVNYGNIHSKNLIAYGGTKDIGASDKYLGVNLSGDLLTASADGSIYIRNMITTGDNSVLRVGSLYAGDTIALNSTQGIEMTKDAQYAQAYLNAGKQLQINVNAQDGMVGSEDAPLRILNNGGVISLTAGSANLKGVKGLLGENTTMKLGSIQTSTDLIADSEGKLETTDNIAAGMTVKLTAKSDITLNNTVAAGTLNKAGDGTIYTGGGGILLTSQQGSISETENGALKAASVVTTSAGDVLLDNESNEFRSFEANGVETGEQDETGNPVKVIGGSVAVYAHAGHNLDAKVADTVYGDVALRNLDYGALTVSDEGIETKAGKNGEEGTILLQQHGSIVVQGALQAEGSVQEWSVNGTVSHAKDIRAGKNADITAAEGIALSDISVAAGGDVSMKALDGPLKLDKTVVSGRDVSLFSDGDILEAKNGSITATGNASVTQKTGDISLLNTVIKTEAGDVAVHNETGAVVAEETTIEAGRDLGVSTESGNMEMRRNDFSAAQDVTVTSQGGNILVMDSVRAGRNLSVSTTGNGTIDMVPGAHGTMSAGQDVTLAVENGTVSVWGNLNPLTATNGNVSIETTGGEIDVTGRIAAAKNVTAESETGDISMTGEITAKENIMGLSLGGDITVTDRAKAGQDLILRTEQDGRLNLESSVKDPNIKHYDITAGHDVVLVADNGSVNINNRIVAPHNVAIAATGSGDVVFNKTVKAEQDISVATEGGAIRTADPEDYPIMEAGNDVKLKTGDGNIQLGNTLEKNTTVRAGNDVTATSQSGDINIYSTVTAGGNIKTETGARGETLLKGNLNAGQDVTVEGRSGTINMHRESVITAGNDVTLRAFDGGIHAQGSIDAGRDATVASRTGGVILADSAAVNADRNVEVEGWRITSYGDVEAGQNVRVYSESENVTVGGKVAAEQDVFVRSRNGNTTVMGEIDAANVTLTVEHGTLTLDGDIQSREDIRAGNQDGDVVMKQNVQAARDLTLSAQRDGKLLIDLPEDDRDISAGRNVTLMTENAALTIDNKITAETGNAYVATTAGDVEVKNTVSAGQDISVKTKSGAIKVTDTKTVPLLDAARDVKLETASGSIELGSADAAESPVQSGRDVIAASTTGNITVQGTLAAGGNIEAHNESGTITMQGVFTAGENVEAHNQSGNTVMNLTGGSVKDAVAVNQGGAVTMTVAEDTVQNVKVTNTGNGEVWLTEIVSAEQDVSVQTENGNILAYGVTNAGEDVMLKTRGGNIVQAGTVTAAQDIIAESTEGSMALIGITEAGNDIILKNRTGHIGALGVATAGNDITALTDSGNISITGNVTADRDVKAVTANGQIRYDGDVKAGNNVIAELGTGIILYGGNVSADGNVTATMGTGIIQYDGSVNSGRDVEARITGAGLISYMQPVNAGRNIIADVNLGSILYNDDIMAGRSIIARTGAGSVTFMGRVTAGKDLPEQIRNGYGKIAYYDRYGLVGYSNSFDVAPVRNAAADDIEIDKETMVQ
ncbi:MAG: leukotoxin LktA family filamentous adhesin [Acidaminococcaceae bacterium]|nr:leukotoxin LktA family filamentous adhesin [Acidaminococcaceae bacterium]